MARAPLLDLRWRLLLAGLMTMFVGCAQDEGSALDLGGSAGTSDEVALALTGVDWGLQWRGVEPEEQGWSVTNDLGITFAVSGGWLLDYSVTLVRCSDAVANAGGGWLSLLGIGTAHAGHETYDDPSEVEAQWGEQLRTLESGTLGERTFDSDEYCGVHWLVARADVGVTSEDGTELSGTSLSVEGSWSVGEESGDLAMSSDFTQGVVLDFPEAALNAEEGASFADLTLVRDASGLFNGIDPRTMNEYAVAWAMLENLADQVELVVNLRPPTESRLR